jgi:ADP-heptose:LPS heptosyltransferase
LGDVVCSLPVAAALKDGHPGCEVVWAIDPRFSGIVELCPSIDQVVKIGNDADGADVLASRFDAALDVQGLFKSGWIVARALAGQKVGFHWQREGSWLFSSKVLPDPTSLHVVDQYVDVARAVGGQAHAARFDLYPDPGDTLRVKERLERMGWDGRPIVVINAGAGWATKRWSPQGFAEVADWLEASGRQPVFLGSKPDETVLDEVRAHGAKQALSLVGQTSVRELVALVGLSQCHLGGDTGSTHIAAALGVPAVGLFTQTRPARSCPYGQIGRCLDARESPITTDAVVALVEGSLAST